MKIILMSGGSGKRLWPLSNDTYSKHFLKFLKSTHGENESMVQRVWKQLQDLNLSKDVLIATNKAQSELIRNQLGEDIKIIVEPERRDTFPCISLASTYLYSKLGCSEDETVIVAPIDSYVNAGYFKIFNKISSIVEKESMDLMVLGVTPTYPATKYGYIVPEEKQHTKGYFKVKSFTEKPTEKIAKQLIEQHALWNCGVFGFKLGEMLDELKKRNISLDFDTLLSNYHTLPKISFDYEIVESATHITAIPYDGLWKDLGTWDEFTSVLTEKIYGNGILNNCTNTHIINNLQTPVVGMGLSNTLISSTPDGILILNKNDSSQVKEVVSSINTRPMFEEKRWGWYQAIAQASYNDGDILVKQLHINAGKHISYQKHFKREEIWNIVNGEGILILDGKMSTVKAGDTIHINKEEPHCLRATTELEFIEIQKGSPLVEEDIVRISDVWEEVLNYVQQGSLLEV